MRLALITLALTAVFLGKVSAGEVAILDVEARLQQDGRYAFSVTLKHADNGWDHYADRWQVLGPDGAVLGDRVLMHPHVNEQPFTRSLSGVAIPGGLKSVFISAHDKIHGDSLKMYEITLPGR